MFYHERLISIPTAKVPLKYLWYTQYYYPVTHHWPLNTTLTHSAQAVTTKGAMPP